jgi:glycine/D-amino acid oxidase-like deaminating enzyme
MTRTPHITVVGAGILGASIAYYLAKKGAQVTVVDEGTPANRATHGSFAWINAHSPNDETYFQFRMASIRLWKDLQAELPALPVRFGGTLNWEDAPDKIEEVQRALNDGGNPARLVSRAEIQRIEPHLAAAPEVAIDASAEGVADPARIAESLLFAALSLGAKLRTNAKVLSLTFASGRVSGVEIPGEVIEADAVVLATGVGTADLLAAHDFVLPMDNAPGLLISTPPVAKVTDRVLTSQSLHVWQKEDGALLLGEDFGGTDPSEGIDTITARVRGKLEGYFNGLDSVAIGTTTVAKRPKPIDGYPALGRVPGLDDLWVATTHSGITLAPLIGESLASEIIGPKMVKALHPYRVHRFAPSS